MATDKPLHVQVAEALGCHVTWKDAYAPFRCPADWFCDCESQCPGAWVPPVGFVAGGLIPRYDTDWSATGPLIERFRIRLQPHAVNPAAWPDSAWLACLNYAAPTNELATGRTPLIAVCDLILRLAKAGKLEHGPLDEGTAAEDAGGVGQRDPGSSES